MTLVAPSFSVGVEEEYLLVDRQSRDLVAELPPALLRDCEERLKDRVCPEFLQSQIEVQTRVCQSISEVRDDLANLRRTVADVAAEHDIAPIAVSTHPFASWRGQKHADKERYNVLAENMQVLARRLLICGLHVHVGIDDDELRIDFLRQLPYFLPHLLALSTSSPFWRGEETGLQSYRISIFDELPRSGLPEYFTSYGEYERTVAVMVDAGLIDDASKLWWDVRPSVRFPTLELRITDMCTRLDDAVCIAAMFRSACRMLFRLRRDNRRWRIYSRLLIEENRWRAQRYGLDEGLVDFGKGKLVPMPDLIDELIGLLAEDAAYFGCTAEINHARAIINEGTSAHRQIATFHAARDDGATREEALRRVVDMLIAGTVAGL